MITGFDLQMGHCYLLIHRKVCVCVRKVLFDCYHDSWCNVLCQLWYLNVFYSMWSSCCSFINRFVKILLKICGRRTLFSELHSITKKHLNSAMPSFGIFGIFALSPTLKSESLLQNLAGWSFVTGYPTEELKRSQCGCYVSSMEYFLSVLLYLLIIPVMYLWWTLWCAVSLPNLTFLTLADL